MKTNIITPEHKTAVQIFLAIFALTAIMFFSSCTIEKDCPGAGKGYVGYRSKPAQPITGPSRHTF